MKKKLMSILLSVAMAVTAFTGASVITAEDTGAYVLDGVYYDPIDMNIIRYPQKYTYKVGDTLDLSGLIIEVNYGGGLFDYYGPESVSVEYVDMSTPGDACPVALSYSENGYTFYDNFYINIVQDAKPVVEKSLSSITIVDYPTMTVFEKRSTSFTNADMNGISVLASYSNGDYEYLDYTDLKIEKYPDLTKAGDDAKEVQVSYTVGGIKKTASYYVYVYQNSMIPTEDVWYPGAYSDVIDVRNVTRTNHFTMIATSLDSQKSSASAQTRRNYIYNRIVSKYNTPSYLEHGYVDVIFVSDDNTMGINNIGKVQEIVFQMDENISKKYNLSVYRTTMNGSSVTEFKKNSTARDGYYKVSGSEIHVYTSYSGTFGFAYTSESGKVKTVKFTNYPSDYNDFDVQYVEYGEYADDPGDAYRSNDTFLGWYNGSTKWDFYNKKVTGNLTLSAKWKSGWGSSSSTDNIATAYLSSIELKTQPTKQFYVNDTFVFDGAVKAKMSDGTTSNPLNSALTITKPDMTTPGDKTIEVSFTLNNTKRSLTYTINVAKKATTVNETKEEETVVAPAAKVNSLKSSKAGCLTVNWTWKDAADGYQIAISTSSSFSPKTSKTIKVWKESYTFKELNSNKVYYVKMRSFVKKNGKTVWSKWSAKKKLKVK